LDDYEKGDEKKVCTLLLQIRVIHKNSYIMTRFLSVEEYVMEFDLLMIRYELTESQEHTIARFISRLRNDIVNIIKLQPYIFLEDMIKLAMRVERQ
jgi:hypothetical protein